MFLESPSTDDIEELTEMWVTLADDQQVYGSHLRAESNREAIQESIGRHVVGDRLRVAREDGRLLGFVMFTVESKAYERTVTRGLIENIYVVADRRREGIGTRLLRAAESALADEGVDVIALDVMADNEGARGFYRHHGYAPHRVTVEQSIENDTSSRDDE
ncbi:MAG: GNAT family N-acetyltransferase [archaeon]